MRIPPILWIVVLFVGLGAALWILERRKPTGFEYTERSTAGARWLALVIIVGVAAAIAVSILTGLPI